MTACRAPCHSPRPSSSLFAVCLVAPAAVAQTPFALQGLGQNIKTGSARDAGRGGWGMADSDTLTPSALNPAALADLRYSGLIFSGFAATTRTNGDRFSRTTRRFSCRTSASRCRCARAGSRCTRGSASSVRCSTGPAPTSRSTCSARR